MAMPSTDTDELAKFGYKQELDRSLGLFSSFAAGFSYISIMTGVFELFFFGFLSGGPAFIWTWPAVFVGQFLVALCFAELAGQFPLAGSVYQWSKQIAKPFTAFFGGWILTVGSIVTLAAVAVAYQVVAPQISSAFEIIGGPADIGLVSTPGGAKNALLLAAVLVVFTTIINMVGVKVMARINNFGVAAELIGVTLLIILLAAHIRRGPGVIFDTFNLGRGYPLGYFGAFLVAGLMSAYVMYGFDTAGSLAEETLDPRKNAPPAILRALAAAGLAGFLVILFGEMATPNIHASQLGTSGLPYLVKATLGGPIGNVFLIDSLIAITVCSLAVHAGGIRMIFTMGRDGRLPFASAIAKVHGKSKTPLVPSLVIGVITILLLVLNVGNQRAFFVLTSVAIIMFYIAYMCVTGPLLIARLRGKWPTPEHGRYFNLGRWGLPVNVLAVIFQIGVLINLAWPRPAVYGADKWYFQWGAFTFTGVLGLVGIVYYLVKLRGGQTTVLAEHSFFFFFFHLLFSFFSFFFFPPAGGRRTMAMPSTDTDELAKFGYKQELDRSLGLFSSFAAGFSYISIMTGVFELFFFGFFSGGPAFIWTWPAVFVGQFLVALCFAELAGQFPLAGSVYQWSKQIAKPFTAFFGGWILTVGSIVTLAAVAVAYQVVAPQISSAFEIIGTRADIGQVATPGGAKNALLLASLLVVFTTIINMVGVKVMARINNFGVAAELIGVTLLIILLAAHIRRGPGVILDTFNLGRGYPLGYFGAFLVAGLMSAYVMYGFDTAGSLAEETLDPRKNAPPAILRALAAAGLAGFLVILFGEMATPNIHASQLGTSGLPYLVKATLGGPIGNVFLIDSLIAITVCSLAVHAGGIRMIFTMGRDGRLPFASAIAKVHGKSKTPLVPSLVIGVVTILLLVLNVGNQRAFFVLTSVAIIMFYIAYMCVTGPLLIARLRGKWPTPEHGRYFNLGRWGLPVNLVAVIFQIGVMINLAWPRPAVYGGDKWYFQWGAFTFTGVLGLVGIVYYLVKLRGGQTTVLAEHRAGPAVAAVGVGDEPAGA